MSALTDQRRELKVSTGLPDFQIDSILDLLSNRMWDWFKANADNELVKVKTLFGLVSVTVRVKHLKTFFEQVFGPSPE